MRRLPFLGKVSLPVGSNRKLEISHHLFSIFVRESIFLSADAEFV